MQDKLIEKSTKTRHCPKCNGSDVILTYRYWNNDLNCRCRTCDYEWSEKPSDAVRAHDAAADGTEILATITYDPKTGKCKEVLAPTPPRAPRRTRCISALHVGLETTVVAPVINVAALTIAPLSAPRSLTPRTSTEPPSSRWGMWWKGALRKR